MDTLSIAHKIVRILEEHKAEEIVLMDVRKEVDFTDYFIICSGTSDRMLESLSNFVIDGVRDEYRLHGKCQGTPSGGWLLLDFGDIIAHLFSPDRRSYYQLEDLWHESKVLLRLQ